MKENRYRNHQVKLRLSDVELNLLDKKVALSGAKSRIDFLRQLIVYGAIFKVDLSSFNEYNTHLARIEKSLNQMAMRVSGTGNLYEDDIIEIRKDMKKIWQLQESMLSKVPSLSP